MSDRHQELLMWLSGLRKKVDAATLTPWRSMESKETWTLHGEARQFKGKIKTGASPSMQILKAAKHGTPYAEYWPNAADGILIVEAVNRLSFWLDWAEDVAKRHYPVVCGCAITHFLCAEHRMYEWDQCPEIAGLIRVMEMTHQ